VGIGPVIGDLASVVIPHDFAAFPLAFCDRAWTAAGIGACARPSLLGLRDEAVHSGAVDVVQCRAATVRTAEVVVFAVVERRHAAAVERIRHAHAGGNPVGSGERAEVGVEGAVLLHDHDDMLDLVDAFERGRASRGGDPHDERARGQQRDERPKAARASATEPPLPPTVTSNHSAEPAIAPPCAWLAVLPFSTRANPVAAAR
jgi:hypothetical protein